MDPHKSWKFEIQKKKIKKQNKNRTKKKKKKKREQDNYDSERREMEQCGSLFDKKGEIHFST